MTLTVDTFSACNGSQFIAVDASFITEQWNWKRLTLGCREVNKSHTIVHIAAKLTDILASYSIDTSRVCSVTTERGSILETTITDALNLRHLPCFAQILKTFVDYIEAHGFVSDIVDKISALYNLLSTNPQAETTLHNIQAELGLPLTRMPSSCANRWWRESAQFEFVAAHEKAVFAFCNPETKNEHDEIVMSARDLFKVGIILALMMDLERIHTTLIELTEANGSLVHPVVAKGQHVVAKVGVEFTQVNEIAQITEISEFRKYIKAGYDELKAELQTDRSHQLEIATFLDPRFARTNANAITPMLRHDPLAQMAELVPEPRPNRSSLQMLLGDDDEDDAKATPVLNCLDHDIRQYLLEAKIPLSVSPLDWWKSKAGSLKVLSQIARKYLCTAATCVPSEMPICGALAIGLGKPEGALTNAQMECLIFLSRNRKLIE